MSLGPMSILSRIFGPNIAGAERARDPTALRDALYPIERVSGSTLGRLLLEEWHDSQEDIVFELGQRRARDAVRIIEKAAATPFQLLDDGADGLSQFKRKCAYALAYIGTEESRLALERFVSSDDPDLREFGGECLPKWPIR